MNNLLPIIFTIVVVILTIILTVVGIQLIAVLLEIKKTTKRINSTLDLAETKFNQIVTPLQSLGGMATGLKTGFKVFETFVAWLNKNKTRQEN